MPRTVHRLEALAAALLFSTGGAAIKYASLSSWQVASFRCGVAAAAILLFIPASRRGWTWRVPLIGLFYAATLIFFVMANKLTTAANAIYLQATAPLYLLFLGPWMLKEKPRRADWFFMGLVAIGLSLFFVTAEPARRTAPDPVTGNLFATLSGVTFAVTIAGLRWVQQHGQDTAPATIAAGNAIGFLFCLPNALPVVQSSWQDWATILYLGLFQVGLAYVFLTRSVKHLSALEAGTILLVEPALNPVWAYFVQGEMPSAGAITGGVLILGASLGRMLYRQD